MKKLILLFFILNGFGVFSQTKSEIDQIADATCECLKEKNFDGLNANEIQMELGMCMISSMSESGLEFDIDDVSAIEKIGEKVGTQLAVTCPNFLSIVKVLSEEDPEAISNLIEEYRKDQVETTFGKVLAVEEDFFVTLIIQNENGKRETFFWFDYFEGSNLLENGGKKIIGKKITVEFVTTDYYSPRIEDYTPLKVLKGIYLE